jgi:hypothetical protein
MMANDTADGRESFIIPSRILRGSRQEMVQDIDQAIVGLLALRHLIDDGASPPQSLGEGGSPRRHPHRRWWTRLFTVPRLAVAPR